MSTPQAPSNKTTADQPLVKFENRYIPESIPPGAVEAYVKRKDDKGNITRPFKPAENELLTTWRDGKHNTYLSFGADGTTASIAEQGQLMQFSRYLGSGSSSVFVADHEDTYEPVLVEDRGICLQRMARFGSGFGEEILLPDDDCSHQVFFLRDRWPRVEFQSEGWKLVTQWMVKDGVVIQQSRFTNLSQTMLEFMHVFDSSILIRDLDFMDWSYDFNENLITNYVSGAGPDGYGWVKVHRFPMSGEVREDNNLKGPASTWYATPEKDGSKVEEGEGGGVVLKELEKSLEPDAIGLVIGFFVDGKAKKSAEFLDQAGYTVPKGETLEIVAGYKLVQLTSKISDWKPLVLSAADVDIDRFLAEEDSSYVAINLGLANDSQTDYAMRRNLEHMLSVCTMPVPSGYVWDYNSMRVPKSQEAKRGVALTCGDMSGHRIVPSASLWVFTNLHVLRYQLMYFSFAFKFLIAIARQLRKLGDKNMVEQHRDRIQQACEAHLRWAFETAEIQNGSFAANHWVNGKIVPEPDDLVSKDLTATPYQVLKAWEYYQEFGDRDGKRIVRNWLGGGRNSSAAMDWIKKLDRENARDAYAWRHPYSTDLERFRLDDHVWIWSALKAISMILDWEKDFKRARKNSKSNRGEEHYGEDKEQKLRRRYEPSIVQQGMTRRFTTEMEPLKQKMLAVTRTVGESRFNFHSRDTALFYELLRLDSKPGSKRAAAKMLSFDVAVWDNTVNCQQYLEENQDPESDNPLRYALNMLMAWNGVLDKDVFNRARGALMKSMLPNGLFPGQIDEITQDKKLFAERDTRDFYFHVGFEVPYAIWTTSWQEDRPEQMPQHIFSPSVQSLRPQQLRRSSLIGPQVDPVPAPPSFVPGKIAFNNFVDSRNISEVTDEWLYKYPPFLDFKPPEDIFPQDIREAMADGGFGEAFAKGGFGEVIKEAIKVYDDRRIKDGKLAWANKYRPFPPEEMKNDSYKFTSKDLEENRGCLILDVSKKVSSTGKIPSGPDIPKQRHSTRYLWNQLQEERKTANAKKRFIWLPFATKDCALMCVLTAHKGDMVPMGLFFEHHANYDCYFFDDAVPIHNKWETEFHMRFVQLQNTDRESYTAGGDRLIQPWSDTLPQFDEQQVVRGSAGYRIVGDFFNHFWTCHFIERYPRKRDRENECPLPWPIGTHKGELVFEEDEKDFWQQRKVLELMLFNRIITEINISTKDIVTRIKKSDRLHLGNLNTEEYFKKSPEWENVIQILGAMESDFTAVMDNISAWEKREQDRQQGQPRWPATNERKYRSAMTKLLVFNQRNLRELRGYQATVKSLRASLVANQERSRNELGLRGQANIQYFTYATVFFLPLGFASSLFAMAAVPTVEVVRSMVIYSLIALAITVFLLSIARFAWKVIKDSTHGISRTLLRTRQLIRLANQKLRKDVIMDQNKDEVLKKLPHTPSDDNV